MRLSVASMGSKRDSSYRDSSARISGLNFNIAEVENKSLKHQLKVQKDNLGNLQKLLNEMGIDESVFEQAGFGDYSGRPAESGFSESSRPVNQRTSSAMSSSAMSQMSTSENLTQVPEAEEIDENKVNAWENGRGTVMFETGTSSTMQN